MCERCAAVRLQHRGSTGYEDKKREVVDGLVRRLEPYFPGLSEGIVFRCACPHGRSWSASASSSACCML